MLPLDGLAAVEQRWDSRSIDLLAISEVGAVLFLLVRTPRAPVVVGNVTAESGKKCNSDEQLVPISQHLTFVLVR